MGKREEQGRALETERVSRERERVALRHKLVHLCAHVVKHKNKYKRKQHVWKRKRKVRQEGRDQVCQSWSPVPSRKSQEISEDWKVRHQNWIRCPSLLGRRP